MTTTEERIVLIDTDAGLDDTLAIMMAVRAQKDPKIPIKIVGITCVFGNTTLDNVTVNVTKVLQTVDATDIPVYRGAAHAMVDPSKFHTTTVSAATHHGSDGFGDLDPTVHLKPSPKLEPENAVSAIIRLANEYAGRLTIVALGPLTNLALAVRADDRIKDKMKEILIMGGSSTARGNCAPTQEFNFICDPESVHVTLTSFQCPMTIFPVELGWKLVVQTRDWRLNVLGKQNTPECDFMNLIEKNLLEGRVKVEGIWRPHDSTVTAALIEPSVVKSSVSHPVWMELHGQHTKGQLVIDYNSKEESHIRIITGMDGPLFQKMLIWTLNSNKFYTD